MQKIFFDVGAYNGISSINIARNEPNTKVYAFEAVPELISKIILQTTDLPNYNIVEKAVCDYDGETTFNVRTEGDWGQGSLLNFTDDVDRIWPNDKLKFSKQINVKVTRLDTFVKENKIDKIDYLHVDTQGCDLKVIKGLGEYINIVHEGVVEAASLKREAYVGQNTKEETIIYLEQMGFEIVKVEANDIKENEVNIFFKRRTSNTIG